MRKLVDLKIDTNLDKFSEDSINLENKNKNYKKLSSRIDYTPVQRSDDKFNFNGENSILYQSDAQYIREKTNDPLIRS